MKKRTAITALVGLGLGLALTPRAYADDTAPDADSSSAAQSSLDQRVTDLEQRLALLSPTSGTAQTAFQGSPASAFASVGRGIGFTSNDGSYGIKFGGTLQEDARNYFDSGLNTSKGVTQQSQLVNEFVNARARFLVDAYLGDRVHVRYQEDFSNNGGDSGSANLKTPDGAELVDAYGELRLLPWTLLRVGQFKTGVDIERWRQTPANDFIQFGTTAGLVVDRSQGAELEIADPQQLFYLSGGAIDGSTDTGNPVVQAYNSDKDAIARLFFQPLNGIPGLPLGDLGLGAGAEGGNHTGAALPTYKSLGQEPIVAPGTGNVETGATIEGAGYDVAPQAYWFLDQFSLLGEYVHGSDNYRLTSAGQRNTIADSEAWQVQGGWVITGEHTSYDGVKLDADSHSWGSLELVARAEGANYDEGSITGYNAANKPVSLGVLDPETSVSSLTSWSVGLNYIPVNDVKFLVDWDQTHFDNGGVDNINSAAGKVTGTVVANRPSEEILQVRAQYAF